MRVEDYTPTNICQCLGLEGFENDSAFADAPMTMRLLLRPSFHPEVCVTFTEQSGRVAVSVVAARTMVWRRSVPESVPVDRDEGEIDKGEFSALLLGFLKCHKNCDPEPLYLDGMPVDGVLVQDGAVAVQFRHNAGDPVLGNFVVKAITAIWSCIGQRDCKSALIEASRYTGFDLPFMSSYSGSDLETLSGRSDGRFDG